MERLKEILIKLNISPDFYEEFLKHAIPLKLNKKDFFVRENEVCDYIGIVVYGNLYSFFEDENIEKQVNGFYRKDSIITSYRSFLCREPSPGSIVALTDSIIYIITFKKYQELKKSLMWLNFFKQVSDILFIMKCQRETSLIKMSASERFLYLKKTIPSIEQEFPQYLIASYLKIRPETLSRIKALM